MSQLSRPYQIALLALGLLVIVWAVALRGHTAATSTGGAGSSPATSAPAPTAASEAMAAAAPTHVYTGPVPGVTGLTRAIAKAHGAVASSQQNAKQVEGESGESSHSPSTTATAGGAGAQSAHAGSPTGAAAKHAAVVRSHAAHRAASDKSSTAASSKPATNGASTPKTHSSSPNMQASVEAELKQGKVVTILFWNPKAAVDRAVQRELQAVGHALGGKIAVHDAHADQVGSFGSITRTIQVDETPTILIVSKGGQTTTLTGLTDVFSLEQAIGEAQKATVK
jgi:hypothetical protein